MHKVSRHDHERESIIASTPLPSSAAASPVSAPPGICNSKHIDYTLLEEGSRWGGHIFTERVGTPAGSFVVEAGPDSFITQKPWGVQLARELGLADRLLGTNDRMRKVYVLNRGKPTPMPDGVLLIVPTRFMPFALSPLISPLGKLRMGLDLIIPPKRDGKDETLADFVRRRLGSEALDKIAEPLLSGIYNSEAERQSLLATFPRFRDLEVKYGSLTRGMLASRRNANNAKPAAGSPAAMATSRCPSSCRCAAAPANWWRPW